VKTIGLLGGMSWESSIEYERLINTEVRRRLGGVHSADLVVRSYDFAAIEALQASGGWEAAGAMLAEDAVHLERARAEIILLCTVTMHRVAPAIEAAISVEFLHLADATATAVVGAGIGTVALLGTRYTMEHEFFRERLERAGLEVRVPGPDDRELIHGVIFDELVQGQIRPVSRERFVTLIERMVGEGSQGVIAGCTEIELLVTPEDVAVPYFPTTRIHALAAVDWALAE